MRIEQLKDMLFNNKECAKCKGKLKFIKYSWDKNFVKFEFICDDCERIHEEYVDMNIEIDGVNILKLLMFNPEVLYNF